MQRGLAAAAVAAVFFGAFLVLSSVHAQFTPGPVAWAPSASPCTSTSKWSATDIGSGVTLSPDRCTATAPATAVFNGVRSTPTTVLSTAGPLVKVYFELLYLAGDNFWIGGLGETGEAFTPPSYPGGPNNHGMGLQLGASAQFYTALGTSTLLVPACNLPTPGPSAWVGLAYQMGGGSGGIAGWCTVNNGTTWNTGGTDTPLGGGSGQFFNSALMTTLTVQWGGGDSGKVVINTSAPFHFSVFSSSLVGAGYSAYASLGDKRQFAGDIPR